MNPTRTTSLFSPRDLVSDVSAGVVVFLVALPLCLGIAFASNAPPITGIITGVLGGVLVGMLSKSHTSVSGPAAGLTAVVAAQLVALGSFETFLLAVVFAGVIQIALGVARAGLMAAFFPSSVIKGLLAAIGLILILKQIPHLLGHDSDPEGEMAFSQPDHENTFTEIWHAFGDIHPGALTVGLLSLALLIFWNRIPQLKHSVVPSQLLAVVLGVGGTFLMGRLGGAWAIQTSHLVQVPVLETWDAFRDVFHFPDFSQVANPAVYIAAVTIATVASLETLLNLEAVDKLDPQRRVSPPSRELLAQGCGNVVAGLVGGLPMTSVVVRGSVNIAAGGRTKRAAIVHGLCLALCVVLVPVWLNKIPLSCLAAILLMVGFKLANPSLVKQMWNEGRNQFVPFAATIAAIVLTDLLTGIIIGLVISIGFILRSNLRSPLRRIMEKHVGGDVLRIELANQVSFLNRATLSQTLNEVPRGGHVLIDARGTDYIDVDVLDLIHDFQRDTAPARDVTLSLLGFKDRYKLDDEIQYVDYSTRELQEKATPDDVLEFLKAGHERFLSGETLRRDLSRQVGATAAGQYPLAVVLSCIDSRTPTELIFDVGLGDIFTVRIAGNVVKSKVLGSMEYSCAVAKAKLVLVMGHTRCGAVKAAVELFLAKRSAADATGCEHLDAIVREIQKSIGEPDPRLADESQAGRRDNFADEVSRRNVLHAMEVIRSQSKTLGDLERAGTIRIVGALYDVRNGQVDFFDDGQDEPARTV